MTDAAVKKGLILNLLGYGSSVIWVCVLNAPILCSLISPQPADT